MKTKMLKWKQKLKEVGDNPNYIEEFPMKSIQLELQKDIVDTNYIRSKLAKIEEWMDEIDKFQFGRYSKIVEEMV